MINPGDVVYLDKRGCFGRSHDNTLGLFDRSTRLEKNVKYVAIHASHGFVRLKHNMVFYNAEHFKKYT